jgi:hypothetical protein
MPKSKPARILFSAIYLAAAVLVTFAALRADLGGDHPQPPLSRAAGDMTAAATAWWNSLNAEEQAKAHFEFNDDNRFDWHFIPRVRKGLPYKEMNSAQRALAVALLANGLSSRGLMQAESIMSLEQILKEIEAGPPKTPVRDPENYSFTIFGAPGAKVWAWRVEGHHFALNITIVDGKPVAGPVFFGVNPAEVRDGPRKGLRLLAHEEDLGFTLVNSLSEGQKKTGVIDAKAPKEMITGNQRKANPGAPVGIAYPDLNDAQKKELVELTNIFARRVRAELAHDDLEKIEKAGWDKVHFAWAGAFAPGEPHYYRIHGPTFLVEFDSVQGANHIHSVWRDSANDFGEDLLKEHYAAQPHDGK